MQNHLVHKLINRQNIFVCDRLAQIRNNRDLFCLYFCSGAHFLIKLATNILVVINAEQNKQTGEEQHQRNKKFDLE